MKNCERCGMKFADVLKALDHKNNFKHTYKQMDPLKKAGIVARMERSLGMFIMYDGWALSSSLYPDHVPTKPNAAKVSEIVIERFAKNNYEPLAGLPEPNWVG